MNPVNAIQRFRLPGLLLAAGTLLLSGCHNYGYGPHAGHPHGAPPGQVKKYYGGHKGHPHGGPPGQMKKHRY